MGSCSISIASSELFNRAAPVRCETNGTWRQTSCVYTQAFNSRTPQSLNRLRLDPFRVPKFEVKHKRQQTGFRFYLTYPSIAQINLAYLNLNSTFQWITSLYVGYIHIHATPLGSTFIATNMNLVGLFDNELCCIAANYFTESALQFDFCVTHLCLEQHCPPQVKNRHSPLTRNSAGRGKEQMRGCRTSVIDI